MDICQFEDILVHIRSFLVKKLLSKTFWLDIESEVTRQINTFIIKSWIGYGEFK